ncbi:MAG: UDP-N-acetylglucosamine 1-carboxyvinyltransferase [Coriobacteriia bacterium]|nr:UDP-N-acetylglucosamine 1-carboxyvinyltransferase [Coriobacteriia bacterium]MCL2750052.1 UDP-N-acetylglucosamine 1-carboxyvinyltransferase [Coriobacteriia bacterium]
MAEDCIIVEGGKPLAGTVQVSGAKNSVLKLMAASIMASGATTITNTPHIRDVDIMTDMLRHLGADVSLETNTLVINTSNLNSYEAPYELVKKMRASTAVLGPLIVRFGKARVAMPGGCQIGSRQMDLHFAALEALGVSFDNKHGFINASVPPSGLKATKVTLGFPSVGATENLMIVASSVPGTTVIENAAAEPEITDLAHFLGAMGANIEGQGSPVITIQGTEGFSPVPSYRTVADRIEAGTFLVAGALGGGPVEVKGLNPQHLRVPLAKLAAMGCELEITDTSVTISHEGPFVPTDIQTLPFPGFPTDLQPQFMVLNALAEGTSVITENIFENRFMFADELARMGANVRIEGHHAILSGVKRLSGAPVEASDLRAGAALVLAGLNAEGSSQITNVEHIYRGYEDLVGKLKSIGADIK